MSDESSWTSGSPAVDLGPFVGNHGCYLTRVAGAFHGSGEQVIIDNIVGSAADLSLRGMAASSGISAGARCAGNFSSIDFPGVWDQNTAATLLEPVNSHACFFVEMQGHFAGAGEEIDITPQLQGNTLFWTLDGRSQQQGVEAAAECVQLD